MSDIREKVVSTYYYPQPHHGSVRGGVQNTVHVLVVLARQLQYQEVLGYCIILEHEASSCPLHTCIPRLHIHIHTHSQIHTHKCTQTHTHIYIHARSDSRNTHTHLASIATPCSTHTSPPLLPTPPPPPPPCTNSYYTTSQTDNNNVLLSTSTSSKHQ